jgi:hypothetical protein
MIQRAECQAIARSQGTLPTIASCCEYDLAAKALMVNQSGGFPSSFIGRLALGDRCEQHQLHRCNQACPISGQSHRYGYFTGLAGLEHFNAVMPLRNATERTSCHSSDCLGERYRSTRGCRNKVAGAEFRVKFQKIGIHLRGPDGGTWQVDCRGGWQGVSSIAPIALRLGHINLFGYAELGRSRSGIGLHF